MPVAIMALNRTWISLRLLKRMETRLFLQRKMLFLLLTKCGDGSKVFETMLPPGAHTLTLQIGDDQHVTQDGLCTTISVTVE